MGVGTTDIEAAPEQVLRNIAQSQAQALLTDHIKKGRCHLDKVLPEEYELSAAEMVLLV
jgi:hypothetical protein